MKLTAILHFIETDDLVQDQKQIFNPSGGKISPKFSPKIGQVFNLLKQ